MLLRSVFLLIFIGINFDIIDAAIDKPQDEWWHDSFVYELYFRSFKDSDGDGVGDFKGITSKLEHIKDLGIKTIWLNPFYPSPMTDFGYDITDFKGIDSLFGNFDDFDKIIQKAKSLDIKVVIDFVPNHTSEKHPWFLKSIKRIKPYDDYYVWYDGKIVNGTRQPPTNWLSIFHGSAWTWNDERQQYYYRTFAKSQPDLNHRNPKVREEMKDILKFWLEKGVDGFRIDTIPSLVEGDPDKDFPLLDQMKKPNTTFPDNFFYSQEPTYVYDPRGSYPSCQSWRNVLEEYSKSKKILLAELYFGPDDLNKTINYYNYGIDVPSNIILVEIFNNSTSISDLLKMIEPYLKAIPKGKSPNWTYGNHDRSRVADKFGPNRVDQMIMFTSVLPGIVIVYQGDEIGMVNRPMTWEETVDPPGCNLGPENYAMGSRDPSRTPFQWDNTTSAGFSTNKKTWLPVHDNYKTLNLAAQKLDPKSHYNVFKKSVALKKIRAVREGQTKFINVDEKVLIVIRYTDKYVKNVRNLDDEDLVVLLINFTDAPVHVNLAKYLKINNFIMTVKVASLTSNLETNSTIETDDIILQSAASIVLTSN